MKCRTLLATVFALLMLCNSTSAQTSAQERAAALRNQLAEVESQQATLTVRLRELEEKLKPENIEQSLAGIGSTRPEDLREQKRRQLEIERDGVKKQFDLLTASKTRLETSIARADAEAYRQSAAPQTVAVPTTTTDVSPTTRPGNTVAPAAPPRRTRRRRTRRARRAHHSPTTFISLSLHDDKLMKLVRHHFDAVA